MTSVAATVVDAPVYRRGLMLVLSAGVCWSIIGIVLRLVESATAWQILFYRSLSLAIFLFLVIALRSRGQPLRVFRQAGLSGVLGGLALVLAFGGSIVSILNTTVANAMFLFATAPFMAAILGLLILKESVRRATWIAMAAGSAGVAVMVSDGIAAGHLLGNAAALVSAVGFALFTIALRWGRNEDMLPAVCLGGIFATTVAAGACLATGQSLLVSGHDLGLAVVLGVFQVGFGLILYTWGSRAVPASELTLLSMTEVVLGPIWVWLFVGELAAPLTMIGGVMLMAAIAGNALSGLRRPPPPITG